MGVTKLEELRAEISADNRDFLKKFKQSEKASKGLTATLIDGSKRASTWIFRTTMDISAMNDALVKSARNAGFTVPEFEKLKTVADRTGFSINTITNAINEQNRALGLGLKNQRFYTKAIKDLGLSQKELDKLSPVERFLAQAKALAGISNQGRRAALANDLFGSTSKSLNGILKSQPKLFADTEAALARQTRQTQKDTEAQEKFQNTIKEIKDQIDSRSFKRAAARKAIPIFNEALQIPLRKLSEQNISKPGGGPGGIGNILSWDAQDKENLDQVKIMLQQLVGN